MSNLFKRFQRLIPSYPLRIGTVTEVNGTSVLVTEVGGGTVRLVGTATVGEQVYFRNTEVVGPAPDLPVEVIEE